MFGYAGLLCLSVWIWTMTDIVWGSAIEVNGIRPLWLDNDTPISFRFHKEGNFSVMPSWRADKFEWSNKVDIRLPADHFAYTAIAKGFTPWGGGSEAPKDWDGGPVLFRDGDVWPHELAWWSHDSGREGGPEGDSDVIGYHPKPIAQPSPADTVTANLTANEVRSIVGGFDAANRMIAALECRNQLQVASRAQTIATKTGLSVKDVEAVLAAVGEGE